MEFWDHTSFSVLMLSVVAGAVFPCYTLGDDKGCRAAT